jgi:DNA-binding transcriptional MerR regulator
VTPSKKEDLYRIGTVASLTGISVERLRAWERRYDLSPAHKSGKTRFYSKPQLERLKLIKHLIDHGQPISSLAGLSQEQLRSRIDAESKVVPFGSVNVPTVGLVGPNLLMLEQQLDANSNRRRVEVVSRWANIEAFAEEQTGTDNPHVLVLQLPVLSLQPVDLVKESLPNTKLVVIYQFGTAPMITKFQQASTPTLKWPVTWSEIEHVALSEAGLPLRAGRAVPRRFSDEELIAIAANSDDETNCPQYLIEAIHQLNAFATYTQDCALTVDEPVVYERVHADATQARAQLELALESLVGDV